MARFKLFKIRTAFLADPAVFEEYYGQMSAYRRGKIDRAKRIEDKRLSLAAGILLDQGLQEIGRREADTPLRFGPQGKPYFADIEGLYFNLAHSKDLAVAVFGDTELGCDVQQIGEARIPLAKRFFCAEELGWMLAEDDDESVRRRFTRLWVLKESFVKATGQGLKMPLDSFSFEFGDTVGIRQQADPRAFRFAEYDFGDCLAACAESL